MSGPWLHVVGLGEDGPDGLSLAARAALEAAELLVGGERHHRLTAPLEVERLTWPSPFDALTETLAARKPARVVVLATGDPLWRSVGATLAAAFPAEEVAFHPHVSSYQLAAARLGWPLEDCETLTAHGRPVAALAPFVQPGRRLLILAAGPETPGEVARLLTDLGWGDSPMTALAHLDGPEEARFDARARDWTAEPPALHVLAVECRPGPDAVIAPATRSPLVSTSRPSRRGPSRCSHTASRAARISGPQPGSPRP